MFYLGSKRLDEDNISAAYGLLNAEGRQHSLLMATIVLLAKDPFVEVIRRAGEEPVDVTKELAESRWDVYDCPALKGDCFCYNAYFELKNEKDFFMMLSIFTTDEGVRIQVTGNRDDGSDDPRIHPFMPMVDAVENFAHYLEGYIVGFAYGSDEYMDEDMFIDFKNNR